MLITEASWPLVIFSRRLQALWNDYFEGRQRASLKQLNYLKVWRRVLVGWLVGGIERIETNESKRTNAPKRIEPNETNRTESNRSAGLVLVGWFGGGGAPSDFKII